MLPNWPADLFHAVPLDISFLSSVLLTDSKSAFVQVAGEPPVNWEACRLADSQGGCTRKGYVKVHSMPSVYHLCCINFPEFKMQAA